jgi:hypothetical protein
MRVALFFAVFLSLSYANILSSWNQVALDCLYANKSSPPIVSRTLAILSVSVHDSFCSIHPGYKAYKYAFNSGLSSNAVSLEGIVIAAYHTVLVSLFPNQMVKLDTKYFEDLEALGESLYVFQGVYLGTKIARSVLADRANDGSFPYKPFSSGGSAGLWIPTPPTFQQAETPQWATVKPWCLSSPNQFRPPSPPSLASAIYVEDFNRIIQLGSKTNSSRTKDQDEIAVFWHEGSMGAWTRIASGMKDNLIEQVHLEAFLHVAFADAAIVGWDAKYNYAQWRPVTAIRLVSDANWLSLVDTPNWPDYLSDRTLFGSVASEILIRLVDNTHAFNITSHSLGVTRSYSAFSDAAFEQSQSGVYAGIHFNSSYAVALECGKKVADWSIQNCFQQEVGFSFSSFNQNNLNVPGIVIGSIIGFILLVILILIIVCIIKRRRASRKISPFVLTEVDSQSNQDL